MRILLTGCNGQVGWEICQQAPSYQFTIIPTDIHNLDITNIEAIRDIQAKEKADIVVNAAAYTAVDRAEDEPEVAHSVNAEGAENLAIVAAENALPILHISTDYVFSGNATSPYQDNDAPDPQGVYGATKLAGEVKVKAANPNFLTLRTSWVFGIEGNNFVKTMLRLAGERDELSVVADQFGAPTYAGHIASALLELTRHYGANHQLAWGNYNFCDSGPTTWHAFAERILKLAQSRGLIKKLPVVRPILTSEFPTDAKRPAYSVLDCSRFAATYPDIGIRDWESGLNKMLQALETNT